MVASLVLYPCLRRLSKKGASACSDEVETTSSKRTCANSRDKDPLSDAVGSANALVRGQVAILLADHIAKVDPDPDTDPLSDQKSADDGVEAVGHGAALQKTSKLLHPTTDQTRKRGHG